MTGDTQTQNQILQAGTKAPDFTLPKSPEEKVSLSEFSGKSVLLIFFPAAFSPVCSDEVTQFNDSLSLFDDYDVQLIGISVDNVWSNMAFAEERGIQFPVLSDFEPKGEVGRRYGVYSDEHGIEQRALFLIDSTGNISWSYLSPILEVPPVDGAIGALEEMQTQ